MEKMNGESMNLLNENIEKLKALFPEIVTDGKIDFDMLKTLLGEEVDASNEKYSFNWVGKRNCIKFAQTPSTGTLIPCKEKSVDFDNTQNIYIEGDNVEALKLLQKTYFGKIKMIYIDPPYNTGSDFVYHDDYKDSIENYKKITGQQATANPEINGRFHTDWLNMMYPRLKLAKDLLADDGVIFISIDDNEQSNLKKICDEIFGDRQFITNFIWEKGKEGGNDSSIMRSHYDNILCYCKDINISGIINLDSKDTTRHIREDKEKNLVAGIVAQQNIGELFQLINLSKQKDYTVHIPLIDGSVIEWPSYAPQKTIDKWIKDGKVFVGEKGVPYIKSYLKDELQGQKPSNIITQIYGTTKAGSIEMREFFGSREFFPYPKPSVLIKRLLSIGSKKDCIVLDFFSGSATTAHAVMQLNAEDGGNRKFIMVQLPELCDEKSEAYKAGYKTICDIGEERIRRAGAKIKEENPLTTLNLDTGFKVFRLDSTNIVPWNNAEKLDEMRLYDYAKTIKDDRDDLSVAYEIMLKYGVFDKPMKETVVSGKKMYDVGEGYMIICLADGVTMTDVEAIARLNPHCVVFKESGFADDNEKINATHTLERGGVEKILCI